MFACECHVDIQYGIRTFRLAYEYAVKMYVCILSEKKEEKSVSDAVQKRI